MLREIKRGDIYMADLNPVAGAEQGGIRPVLIIQNDIGNRMSGTVIVIPITSREKPTIPTHHKLRDPCFKNSTILAEQIRTIDKSRIIRYIMTLPLTEMKKVNRAIRVSLEL